MGFQQLEEMVEAMLAGGMTVARIMHTLTLSAHEKATELPEWLQSAEAFAQQFSDLLFPHHGHDAITINAILQDIRHDREHLRQETEVLRQKVLKNVTMEEENRQRLLTYFDLEEKRLSKMESVMNTITSYTDSLKKKVYTVLEKKHLGFLVDDDEFTELFNEVAPGDPEWLTLHPSKEPSPEEA